MRRLRRIFNQIMGWLGWRRVSRPEDIPKKLSPEMLEKAMEEARFLRANAVDVRALAPGEVPGVPRRADE